MPDDRGRRIEDLFHEALKRDPADRAAFLDEACARDPDLKEEVTSLLEAGAEDPGFLEEPAWSAFAGPVPPDGATVEDLNPEPNLPFGRLGGFRLIRRLGEGGMGVVYLAVQEPLGRLAALKVIRPERLGDFEAAVRFTREVEAVSELRDPRIVTVYGSGEEQGVRWFAMEYVPGKGLDGILAEAAKNGKRIPIPETLCWVRDIARALDSAHEAGVIHRDVKPSNIRVTPEGGAMLLDFGVARRANLATLTLTGEFRGTPSYASPEQIRGKGTPIDGRTDVYSLGATLYEAVTGRVPFEGDTTEQVFHRILVEDPPPPATLNPSISRDLNTVILTAMEKDPERRYRSGEAFAADLDRLMSGEMILARPAGLPTRVLKRLKRHPVQSTAAAVSLAAMAVLFAYVLWSYPQIVRERNKAEKERKAALAAKAATDKEMRKALAIKDFLQNMLSSADPGRDGRQVKVVDVLKKAGGEIEGAFPDQPEVEAEVRNTIGMTYRALGLYGEAERQAEKVLLTRRRLFGPEHRETLKGMNNLAACLSDAGREEEAIKLSRETLETSRRVLGKEDRITLSTMINLAASLKKTGRLDEARRMLDEALETSRRAFGKEDELTLAAMTNLAALLRKAGELERSEALQREVLSIKTRVLGKDHPDTLISLLNLGNVLFEEERLEEAEGTFRKVADTSRRVLGETHPDTIARMHNLAVVLDEEGKLAEAESLFGEVLKRSRAVLGREHPDTLAYINSLAYLFEREDRFGEAETLYRQGLAIAEKKLPPGHFYTALLTMNLGETLLKMKRYGEAEPLLAKSLKTFKASKGAGSANAAYVLSLLIRLYEEWGKPRKAESLRAAIQPPPEGGG